ncbi:arsenosugar biosynthesis radical SAM protein ArsS [Microvirga sp. STR05]|uniref:Arsenosugar biosynthesis radical SAM protein ArsS n=1 Tax=Hymenobacter duratus TaxID=2771356 RepID=A0ABR8JPI1_9BACT|nr:arsenosugar biosynthesis radical SAM (seleno)protein ArsS [Hymenobacter duratus]MBD2717302.1 arsenosugar biosynthesis radical SAM protein ArsS [Hymenobacter duratus]MBR7952222.1 arsenosugar biosynthesis radical SAM protein ArsS [Microvirga sp. STR05]
MKSLKATGHQLADSSFQLTVLRQEVADTLHLPLFHEKLAEAGLFPLVPVAPAVLQINVGKMCNQVCKHCHVDAGPDRKEIMTRETMQLCLDALARTDIPTVDLTGGAPEMNPDFRWFVEQLHALGRHVIVRCNLTIIVANKKYHDLPEFFRAHGVEVVSSLPFYNAKTTDRQRGDGVFEDSIRALKMLNAVGYGQEGSGLTLNLVYNPNGAFLPGSQRGLQEQFKRALGKDFGIVFNELFAITNIPVSRYLDFLIESGNYAGYMEKLVAAFNPTAAAGVMCRNTISVSWDGYLYDCDFNQMLELNVASPVQHIRDFDVAALAQRSVVINQHCYGCTAGSGSSCGGATA